MSGSMCGNKKQASSVPFQIKKGALLPVGITQRGKEVNLSFYVPKESICSLLIYQRGDQEPVMIVPMEEGQRLGSIWAVCLKEFESWKYEYSLSVDGKILADSYARCLADERSQKKAHISKENEKAQKDIHQKDSIEFGKRNMPARYAFSESDYDWEGDALPHIPLHEVIGYALHVRGFTKHASSKVRHKGTFAGITEKLSYLKELGINQIELMPAYEFDEVVYPDHPCQEETELKTNYWGYGPAHYFAPKRAYAAGSDPCLEFKDMIKACHQAGIEVIMEFYFLQGTNALLIIDCIRYWVMEYHVDGFHLNSGDIPLKELMTDPILADIKLYASGFPDLSEPEMSRPGSNSKGEAAAAQKRFAVYQDGFMQNARRLLKSDEDQLGAFVWHLAEQPEHTGIINYLTSHNGFTLFDLVSYDQKHNEDNGEENRDGSNYNYSWNCGEEGPSRKKKIVALRKRQIKNALTMLYFSQGIPMLLAGDEMGNSQNGNNNAYCLDNEITWLQWNKKSCQDITDFVKLLIKIRREHPILHQPQKLRMMDVSGCGYPDLSFHGSKAWYAELDAYNRHVGVMYCDCRKKKDESVPQNENDFDILYIAYNLHWIEHEFALPHLPKGMEWQLIFTTEGEAESRLENQQMFTLAGRTVALLTGHVEA